MPRVSGRAKHEERPMSTSVVLITGALTGIGRAVAIAFSKKGAKVVVSGRRDEAGKALAKELRAMGSEAEFINADVRKEDDVRALVDKTVARFGRLDVAVNNAATEGRVGPITDQTAESFAATFETNVLGVVLSMKHEVRAMQAQGSGSIINISSTYGHEGAAGASIYAHGQLIHHAAEHPGRPARHLPRLQSRVAVSTSRAVCAAHFPVPGCMTSMTFGLRRHAGREIEGVSHVGTCRPETEDHQDPGARPSDYDR